MNELVTLITQKTGLSNEMAQQCLNIVEGYCKDRVPEPMASQISSVLGGQVSASPPTPTTGDANQAANQGKGFLGNLFGGKSENQPTP